MKANFEYDPSNSASNKAKHGIDFEEAQALWDDSGSIVLASSYGGEARFLIIGMIDSKHWTVIFTYRAEKMRIISARRSRKDEKALYERGN